MPTRMPFKRTAQEAFVKILARRGFELVKRAPPDYAAVNNSAEALDAFFANPATVERYLSPARLTFYREVAQLAAERIDLPGSAVCDVGCGTGHLLKELAERGAAPRVGYDFSAEAVALARSVDPDAHFEQRDVYEGLPADEFDLVLCCEVLEHLWRPADALGNLAAATREAGALLLTVPNGRRDTSAEHVNFWSGESWEVFLADALPGWSIETGEIDEGPLSPGTLFAFARRP